MCSRAQPHTRAQTMYKCYPHVQFAVKSTGIFCFCVHSRRRIESNRVESSRVGEIFIGKGVNGSLFVALFSRRATN